MLNYKYKSYRVVDNSFEYVEMINGKEVNHVIPLMIDRKINPLASEIVNEINKTNTLIKEMSKKAMKKLNKDEILKLTDFYKRVKSPTEIYDIISEYLSAINDGKSFYKHVLERDITISYDEIDDSKKYRTHDIDKMDEIEHVLYLSLDKTEDILTLASLFEKKCKEKNIPYKFKINTELEDVIIPFIIYSDIEHLLEYVNILKEIEKENPTLLMNSVPMLTGRIDDFIGYANVNEFSALSYFKERANLIDRVVDKSLLDYFKQNKDVVLNDKEPENLASLVASNVSENIGNLYNAATLVERKILQGELYRFILENMDYILNDKNRGAIFSKTVPVAMVSPSKVEIIDTKKRFIITQSDILKVLKNKYKQITEGKNSGDDFKKIFEENLKKELEKNGIDIEKMCFDEETKEEFKSMDIVLENRKAIKDLEQVKSNLNSDLLGNENIQKKPL